jgi:hypothetical protein
MSKSNDYECHLTYSHDWRFKNDSDAAHTLLRRIEKLVSQSSDVEEDPMYVLWRIKLAIEAYENDTLKFEDFSDYDESKKDIDDILGLMFREPFCEKGVNKFNAERAVDRSFKTEFNGWLRRVSWAEQIRTPLQVGLLIRALEKHVVLPYMDALWTVEGDNERDYDLSLAVTGAITFTSPELYACLGMEMPTQELQEIA